MSRIYLGVAGVVLVVLLGLWINGLYGDLELAEERITTLNTTLESERIKLATIQLDLAFSRDIIADHQNVEQEIKYVDRIVTQEVIKYRDRVEYRFALPTEWVHTYNLSTMRLSEAGSSSGIDGSSNGIGTIREVDDATALEVISNNNRICVREIEKLRSLQKWVKGPS